MFKTYFYKLLSLRHVLLLLKYIIILTTQSQIHKVIFGTTKVCYCPSTARTNYVHTTPTNVSDTRMTYDY